MLAKTCLDKAKCTIDLTEAKILEYFNNTGDCGRHFDTMLNKKVYVGMFCKNAMLVVGDNAYSLAFSEIAMMVTMLDALVIIVFIYMMMNLKVSGQKTIDNIMANSLSANSLTIEVTNLPKDKPKEQLIAMLWTHYEKYYNGEYKFRMTKHDKTGEYAYLKDRNFKIVDIQISQGSKVMSYEINYNKLINKKIDIIKSYRRDYDKDKKLPAISYLQDLAMHFSTEVPEKKQAKVAKILDKLRLLED